MKKIFIIFSGLFIFNACSHKMTSSSPAKPKPATDAHSMYTTSIRPILEAKCTPCHFAAQGGSKAPLDNFDSVAGYIDDVIVRVQLPASDHRYMPFRGKKDPLTIAEIDALKAWRDMLSQHK